MPYSFAQNAEDVLLWRCFRTQPTGFYVDVGASSPISDNVTQVFYEHGWTGLNIEPLPARARELARLRPRDRTLCLAAGRAPGTAKISRQRGIGGLSALQAHLDPDIGPYMADAWEIECQVAPLSTLLEGLKVTAIDFLKIDVEGAEADVLTGLDLVRWRPAVIVMEATRPMTQTPSYAGWEPGLLAAGYRHVAFDGLNRFYLADERIDLEPHFATAPNVFDAMPRFGAFGRALRNPEHPDHAFAQHFANLLLTAPGIETDAYVEAIIRKDRPPALFDQPVTPAAIAEIFLAVFGSRPSTALIEKLSADPGLTGEALLRQLLASHDFRVRRARVAAG